MIRFQHILGLLNRKEPVTLTDAAMLGGYYDQAHFTREFKSFCGLLPSDYIKLPG
ncbi:Helix-turn-helix domain protein [compost metagenome]